MTLTELLIETDKTDGDVLCNLTNEVTSLNNKIREIQFKMFIGNIHYAIMFVKRTLEHQVFKDLSLKLTFNEGDFDGHSYIWAFFANNNGDPIDNYVRDLVVPEVYAPIRENFNEIFIYDESFFGRIKESPYILKLDQPLYSKIDILIDSLLSKECKSIYLNALLEGELQENILKERKNKI